MILIANSSNCPRRNTRQKHLILETIKTMHHPSAEEIYAEVSKTCPKISRGTVFRNVNALADDNILIHIPIANQADRYELMTKNHSHFVCEKCGSIIDISYVPEVAYIKSDDFVIKTHELIFKGICKKCLEKEDN